MQRLWPLVAAVLLVGCETTKVVGLGEDCDNPPCCSLVGRECADGLTCADNGVCVASSTPASTSSPAQLPEPTPHDAGRHDATPPSDTNDDVDAAASTTSDASVLGCTPGQVESTPAGCPAGQYRTRECRADGTWTNFSKTCS